MTPCDIRTREMYDVWLRCSPASDPLPMQGTGFLKPAGDSGGGVYVYCAGKRRGIYADA
ncbi:MAG: hypothetical protein Pg6C_01880 [Treponemataceae bacterium]|nr:MAG: hypothetical protein Pg6C_01880 [Treponemataceae bacterium]